MSRLSPLADESSMPSLVLAGLQSIYRLTARKHKALRQECEEIITAIQADDAAQQAAIASTSPASPPPPLIADTDADKYFLPFKLACESDNAKMIATALNHIEKLIAYGYLDGASYADPEVYPVKKVEGDLKEAGKGDKAQAEEKKAANGAVGGGVKGADAGASTPTSTPDTRRLIAVIVDTVHHTSFNRDREVQLQSLKAILTAVTSVSCQVHGQPLVTAAYSCWNIHLQAVDDIIKNTARATLTQLFNLAFQRMESFAVQLKQLEQSAALSAAVAGEDGGKQMKAADGSDAGSRKREKEEQKEKGPEGEGERERSDAPRGDEEKVTADDDKAKEQDLSKAAADAPRDAPTAAKDPAADDEKVASPKPPPLSAVERAASATAPSSIAELASPSQAGLLSPSSVLSPSPLSPSSSHFPSPLC